MPWRNENSYATVIDTCIGGRRVRTKQFPQPSLIGLPSSNGFNQHVNVVGLHISKLGLHGPQPPEQAFRFESGERFPPSQAAYTPTRGAGLRGGRQGSV